MDYYPAAYDLATGGLLSADDTNDLNVQRELELKLGFKKHPSQITFIGQEFYQDNRNSVWGNVYHLKLDADDLKRLQLGKQDAEEAKFMTKEEIREYVEEQSQAGFTGGVVKPDSIKMFDFFLTNSAVDPDLKLA